MLARWWGGLGQIKSANRFLLAGAYWAENKKRFQFESSLFLAIDLKPTSSSFSKASETNDKKEKKFILLESCKPFKILVIVENFLNLKNKFSITVEGFLFITKTIIKFMYCSFKTSPMYIVSISTTTKSNEEEKRKQRGKGRSRNKFNIQNSFLWLFYTTLVFWYTLMFVHDWAENRKPWIWIKRREKNIITKLSNALIILAESTSPHRRGEEQLIGGEEW